MCVLYIECVLRRPNSESILCPTCLSCASVWRAAAAARKGRGLGRSLEVAANPIHHLSSSLSSSMHEACIRRGDRLGPSCIHGHCRPPHRRTKDIARSEYCRLIMERERPIEMVHRHCSEVLAYPRQGGRESEAEEASTFPRSLPPLALQYLLLFNIF